MAFQIKQRVFFITLAVLGIILIASIFFDRPPASFSLHRQDRVALAEEEAKWQAVLTSEQYAILRKKDTERPFSSPLNDEKRPGTYYTVDTHEPVFRSEDKFDSGTGWPSFTKPIKSDALRTAEDSHFGLKRTEVLSSAGGHLGHVFHDGPAPTGLRYCINGAALYFVPDK